MEIVLEGRLCFGNWANVVHFIQELYGSSLRHWAVLQDVAEVEIMEGANWSENVDLL